MKTFTVLSYLTLCAVFGLTESMAAQQNQALSTLAEKIVSLRSEVETLNTEHNARKEELSGELKSLNARRSQINAQIEQQEMTTKQTRSRLETIKAEIAKNSVDAQTLKPIIEREIQNIKKVVMTSLPFQKEKRMEDLKKVEDGLATGTMNPQQAMGRLWAFIEDELRLGKENGIHRQMITLDGAEHLVSVAKLGMAAMFYKTTDNRVGYAHKKEDGAYEYVAITDKKHVESVLNLFDGLKKQIRTGRYDIPNIL
jgi:TolA-binding protein